MTEPTVETPAETTPVVTEQAPAQDVNTLPAWARESITKANQEAAKYRVQVNELKPKADQFAALEEASKSELQRSQDTAEAARRDAETAKSEAIRYKAAATYGIGADHFDLLGSGTEEEIAARAAKIAALTAQAAPAAALTAPTTRPVEQLKPGATPSETESEDDVTMRQLFGPPS